MQWERRKKDVSIHTKVEKVLEKYGVKIQAYHGGSLTGVAIIALLNNHAAIMDDITKICHNAINARQEDILILRPPSIDSFNKILTEHWLLFQAQDAVYAHLHLIHPTVEEKKQTRERILLMRKLWFEIGLAYTPKAHLIFEHAADDQERFDGIGDKIEDPLEKRHQEQKKYDMILSRMKCYEQQMETQFKYEWRNNNPLVVDQINYIKERTSRKRKIGLISLSVERNDIIKKERQQQRLDNISSIKTLL